MHVYLHDGRSVAGVTSWPTRGIAVRTDGDARQETRTIAGPAGIVGAGEGRKERLVEMIASSRERQVNLIPSSRHRYGTG